MMMICTRFRIPPTDKGAGIILDFRLWDTCIDYGVAVRIGWVEDIPSSRTSQYFNGKETRNVDPNLLSLR